MAWLEITLTTTHEASELITDTLLPYQRRTTAVTKYFHHGVWPSQSIYYYS